MSLFLISISVLISFNFKPNKNFIRLNGTKKVQLTFNFKIIRFTFSFQIPFSLTLRVWDLYLLEGERVMIAMAYNILRMHRRFLSKLQMDEIIEHLQVKTN
jgi:hypothetical protein